MEHGVYSVSHVVEKTANAVWKHTAVRGVIDAGLAMELYGVLKMLIEDVILVEASGEVPGRGGEDSPPKQGNSVRCTIHSAGAKQGGTANRG